MLDGAPQEIFLQVRPQHLVRSVIPSHGPDPIADDQRQEADDQALLYLRDSKQYNPVAMLTVVEGLAKIEAIRLRVGQERAEGRPARRTSLFLLSINAGL